MTETRSPDTQVVTAETSTSENPTETRPAEESLLLQRRVLRLLMQHHEKLFRGQFRLFFAESSLPQLPLLQQYDRYIKLYTFSNELLDALLPRIRRQLSLKISHTRLYEEAPTRGDIDWPRTLERSWTRSPGQPPLQFATRLRQHTLDTPENVLVVAILLAFRQELEQARTEGFIDEDLSKQEQAFLASAKERTERELAAPYARALLKEALHATLSDLEDEVRRHLRPGKSPYRDLLLWWHRFQQLRVGHADAEQALALTSRRSDEKTDAWLYELWIMLEFLHLLHAEQCTQFPDLTIAPDHLAYTFTWKGDRFRLLYNRQLDTATSFASDWEHGPSSRPDYTIEREKPLEIRHQGKLIWREPPVILDAKYYLGGSDPTNTHGPIKKLLGDMTLLSAQRGILFFPRLPEPAAEEQVTRTVRRTGQQYRASGESVQQVHLYHLEPTMPFIALQKRLRAVLDLASQYLPERPMPTCQGVWLDPDTVNASHHTFSPHTVLCPKPHIGPSVFDLVNASSDCLKNASLCHVMGQSIIPPFVARTATPRELQEKNGEHLTSCDESC